MLSGLEKYTYSKIQNAGGFFSGRETIPSDLYPSLLISTISPTNTMYYGSLFCQDETIAKFYYNIVNGLPLLTMDKTKFKIQYID